MVILNYIESQKKFSDCINPDTGHQLRFDFYLPEENILIEYDGKQHFCFVPEWTKDKQNFIKRKKSKKQIFRNKKNKINTNQVYYQGCSQNIKKRNFRGVINTPSFLYFCV